MGDKLGIYMYMSLMSDGHLKVRGLSCSKPKSMVSRSSADMLAVLGKNAKLVTSCFVDV